jgi:cytochrome c oxidase subunit IV
MAHEEERPVSVVPADKERIWKIWRVAIILAIVTGIEFLFAFTMDRGLLLVSIFIVLTIVKAAYIVGEFMHLKYEHKVLFWSILLPMIFVVWLIVALLVEGGSILLVR